MRILISTGEVSGDVAGALVAAAVRRREPAAELFGLGGARLAAAGVEVLRETNHLGCVGFTETFASIPALAGAFRGISRAVARRQPRAALLIGNDLFNCLLARWLRRSGVSTVCYFPPQVWLWRSLARPIGQSYDAVLTSFPEEDAIYRAHGAPAHFVGHYLCDRMPEPEEARAAARARFGLSAGDRVLALLPGSRTVEVRKLGPVLIEAAGRLRAEDPTLRFLVPLAEPRFAADLESLLDRYAADRRSFALVTESHAALAAADLALMASGTASLEATLLGTPMVLLYRLSPVTMAAVGLIRALGMIDARTVGLPNLLSGEAIVPELRQGAATAERLAAEARSLLVDAERRAVMRAELARVRPMLARPGTIARVADCVIAMAEGSRWPATESAPPVRGLATSWSR